MKWAAVAVAGALGAVARYALGQAVGVRVFPWTTLGINVSGAFALGYLLAGPLVERLNPTATAGIAIGFLGAFTTFSTFGFETVALARDDRLGAAAAYVTASMALGIGASALGYWVGRATTT